MHSILFHMMKRYIAEDSWKDMQGVMEIRINMKKWNITNFINQVGH